MFAVGIKDRKETGEFLSISKGHKAIGIEVDHTMKEASREKQLWRFSNEDVALWENMKILQHDIVQITTQK